MKINLCKLFGHSVRSYDDGHPICHRCGAHGYWDNYDFYLEWHYWPYRLIVYLETLPDRIRHWQMCRRIKRGNTSDDEIPF